MGYYVDGGQAMTPEKWMAYFHRDLASRLKETPEGREKLKKIIRLRKKVQALMASCVDIREYPERKI